MIENDVGCACAASERLGSVRVVVRIEAEEVGGQAGPHVLPLGLEPVPPHGDTCVLRVVVDHGLVEPDDGQARPVGKVLGDELEKVLEGEVHLRVGDALWNVECQLFAEKDQPLAVDDHLVDQALFLNAFPWGF